MDFFYPLLLLPAIPVIVWAVYSKIKALHYYEAMVMCVPAIAVFASSIILYNLPDVPAWLHWLQMLLSSSIVPLAYLYFSRQIGRRFYNGTNIVLWLLLLLLFLPNVVLCLPGETSPLQLPHIRRFTIYFMHGGKVALSMFVCDFVMLLQATLTLLRVVPLAHALRSYGLKLDAKVYAFVVWWLMAVIFIATKSIFPIEVFETPIGSIYYFGGLLILLSTIYSLIALNFDLHPIQTADGEVVKNVESYINEQQSSLAEQVRHVVEEEKVYLQPGYRTEDILKTLATNRTYFTRMMQECFGKTFSQYLNEHRIAHAQHLFLTTDLTQNDIAEQSGFNNATYMSRMFKSAYNLTPKQWQTHNKK